ncbi:MAG: (2Fe-2S)-binding protein [Actinomycetota bacterium]
MVICHCRAVNDRVIRLVASGPNVTVADVTEQCGAGGDCGGCTDAIEQLIAMTQHAEEAVR